MRCVHLLALGLALVGCSLIDDYDHAQPPASIAGQMQCLPDGTCERGNQGRVLICVQQQCVRPGFSGNPTALPEPVRGSETVQGNLIIDSRLPINPDNDSPIRIEAENITIKAPVVVNGNGSLTQIEFVARNSILLENGAFFSASNGEALFLFLARQKLYQDGDVQFDDSTCPCLYSDGGDETGDIGTSVTAACAIDGATCIRPNF